MFAQYTDREVTREFLSLAPGLMGATLAQIKQGGVVIAESKPAAVAG